MIITKQPNYEEIVPQFGTSLVVKQFIKAGQNTTPRWHVHKEVELVYINGGAGKRYIGNNQSYYQDGDLILIGAYLPHYGFTDRLTNNHSETLIQLKEQFLGETFFDAPEMNSIMKLLEKAKQGLVFYGNIREEVGPIIEDLPNHGHFDRIIILLKVLHKLSQSDEFERLNKQPNTLEIEPQDQKRINMVYDFVKNNFKRVIKLEEIADEISMTAPAFCRYFKKVSNKTFTQFVNEYRLVHACKLLVETTDNITDICYECGYNNFSHFNTQFKQMTGKSASAYRNAQAKLME